jgi:Helicase associated domain
MMTTTPRVLLLAPLLGVLQELPLPSCSCFSVLSMTGYSNASRNKIKRRRGTFSISSSSSKESRPVSRQQDLSIKKKPRSPVASQSRNTTSYPSFTLQLEQLRTTILLEKQDEEIKKKKVKNDAGTSSPPLRVKTSYPRRQPWDFYYNLLLVYKEQNGHLRIPQSYAVDGDDGRAVNLGVWLIQQRQKLKLFLEDADSGKVKVGTDIIYRTRIEQLNAIGFVWDIKNVEWQENFELLLVYKKEFQHLRIPAKYTTSL